MKVIKLRYFVTISDFSEEIERIKKCFKRYREMCIEYAESLGAISMTGHETHDHFYPEKLLFKHRFEKGGIPSWLCGETEWYGKWSYAPKRTTKKGREVYEKLSEMTHPNLEGMLLQVLGVARNEAIGLFEGRPCWVKPHVIHSEKDGRLYLQLPAYSDEQGYPPQLVDGLKEIEHWEFVKGVEQ